jgi:hypothetical protein
MTPAYHFQAAFSTAAEYRLFRDAPAGEKEDTIGMTADAFPGLAIIERHSRMTRLDGRDALVAAVEAACRSPR